MDGPQFHQLIVARVVHDPADAVHVTFAVPGELAKVFRHEPGQHVTVRAAIDGVETLRWYSITSVPGAALEITIKRVADGVFSNWVRSALCAGMLLDVAPAAGRFMLPPGQGPRTILAIVAGSGITPILSMLRHGLATRPDDRFVLIYGNRTEASILFREELDDLKDRAMGRLSIAHVLSRAEGADVPLLSGRIDDAKLEALVPRMVAVDQIAHAVLCGPDTLIKTAMKTLQRLGLKREQIGFEFFARGERRAAPAKRESPEVAPTKAVAVGTELVAVLDGVRRAISMKPDESVLQAVLRVGLNAPYSCTAGMCCTCRARVVEGRVTMANNFSLQAEEEAAGFVLTCQARPTTPRVVIDYDQV